jgi:hypothetical protein
MSTATEATMREATRLPRDVRIRLVYQGILTAVIALAVVALAVGILWFLFSYMHELRLDLREHRAAHRVMLTEHTTFLVEYQRAFNQTLADHQAQMRALQEGR